MDALGYLKDLLVPLPARVLYDADPGRRYGPGPRLLSRLRRWRLLLTHPHVDIQFLGPVFIGPGFAVHIPGRAHLIVGPDVEFRRHCRIELTGEGTVTIGARSVLTWDVTLQCTQSIVLGPDCVVSQGVSIIDGQHRFRDPSRPILEQGFEWNPVAIGDGAWIGAKCTVMADVGTRAVVGANSVVTRDVPPFTMAAGAPARVIHELDTAGASPGSDA